MAGRIIDVTMQLIDKVTQPLQGVTASLADSNKQWTRAGKEITNTGRSIANVGQGLTTAITLPVAAAGTAAFNNFAEVDKTLSLVQQTMGSTSEEAKVLEKSLMDAAGSSVFGMSDAAEASLNFARAGFTAKQAADMVAPSFDLAAGTATDLSVVTEGLGSTMKLFGADTSEAANYSNIFAQAQAQANTTVGDMFESMSAAGSTFTTVGWSVKDLAVATGVLGDAMVSGSEAGNGLKSGLANLASNDAAISMLEKLGVSVINEKGEFESFITVQERLHKAFEGLTQEEQINAATSLFGKNQMSKWLTIINRSPEDIQGMVGALDQVNGKAKEMSDALMSGSGGAMESLKSSIDVLSYSMGQFVAQYATPAIKKITDIVDKFNALDDSTKDQIVRWAGIAAAVGPALLVFGKVVMVVGRVATTIGKIGSVIKAAGGVMAALTGPGAIVVAVLAAIAVAAVLVVTHWDQVKAAAQTLWDSIQPIVQHLQEKWQALGEKFNEVWTSKIQPAWQKFSEKANALWTRLQPIFSKIAAIVKEVFEIKLKLAIDVACKVFEFLFDTVGAVVESILGALGRVIDFIGGFIDGWSTVWNAVNEVFASAWEGIQAKMEVISPKVDALKQKFEEFGQLFSNIWNNHIQPTWQKFSDKTSEVWTLLQPILEKIGSMMKDIFEVKFKFAIDIASAAFQFLGDIIGSVVQYLIDTWTGMIDFVIGVFTGDWERAWEGIKGIFEAKWELIKGIASAAVDFMSGLVSGLVDAWNGLLNIIGLAKDKADQVPSTGSGGGYAVGTSYFQGGVATVHERGAEIIDLPRGSRIYPHAESLKMAYNEGRASGGGKGNITITVAKLADNIQVRNDSDIETLAVAIANKLEQTAQNIGGGELGYVY